MKEKIPTSSEQKSEQAANPQETPKASPSQDFVFKKDITLLRQNEQYFRSQKQNNVGDPDFLNFLSQCQSEIGKLSDLKNVEDYQRNSDKAAMSLSQLAFSMAVFNPEINRRDVEDKQHESQFQTSYDQSKTLFMNACAKIFPDKKVTLAESI